MQIVSNTFSGVVLSLALVIGLAIATPAQADFAQVVTSDGQFTLGAAPLEGVLSGSSSVLSQSDLLSIHDFVNSYDIETANKLTFLLLATDSGLAFVNLFDDPLFEGSTSLDASLGWMSLTQQGTTYQATEEMFELNSTSLQALTNVWEWVTPGEGEALALTNLQDGQWVSNLMGWGSGESSAGPMEMQFLSWTGSDLTIEAETSASSIGQYAFGYMITSLIPAPGALSLLVVAGLTRRRRRRR